MRRSNTPLWRQFWQTVQGIFTPARSRLPGPPACTQTLGTPLITSQCCDLFEQLCDIADHFIIVAETAVPHPETTRARALARRHRIPYMDIVETDVFHALKEAVENVRALPQLLDIQRPTNHHWLYAHRSLHESAGSFLLFMADKDKSRPLREVHTEFGAELAYRGPLLHNEINALKHKSSEIEHESKRRLIERGARLSLTAVFHLKP